MKKIFIMMILLFASSKSYSHQFCWSNLYLDFHTGANFIRSSKDWFAAIDFYPGVMIGESIGYRLNRFFCIEAELAYRRNKISNLAFSSCGFGRGYANCSGNISSVATVLDGILELPLRGTCIKPYGGFGLGYLWSDLKLYSRDYLIAEQRGWVLCYQGIIGLKFPIFCKTTAGIEYRYLNHFVSQPGNHSIDMKFARFF